MNEKWEVDRIDKEFLLEGIAMESFLDETRGQIQICQEWPLAPEQQERAVDLSFEA